MENKIEAAETFAQYAASLKYEHIPTEVRESTKRSILDTLGVTIAASTQGEGYKELIGLIKDGGGKEESTVIGFGGKVPAWMAAYANGAMARALMYDDGHDEAHTHPSSATVTAALAVAERIGKVNGKEFITAVILGNDITSRMGLSTCMTPRGRKTDWCLVNVHGVFGAAAACGKLLGLDVGKMQNAFGIALYESAGTMEAYSAGHAAMMTGMSSGFTAKGAVLSALMAEKGITGARNSLEGKAGLYNVHFRGEYNRDVLMGDLGKTFESANIGIKPWPGVRYTHSYIEATLKLMREYHITSQNISQVTVFVAGMAQTLCEPLEVQRQPATSQDANRSLPYLVAVAATKGGVKIKDMALEALRDPATLQFVRKIVPEYYERFSTITRMAGPGKVEIRLNNGKSYSMEIDIPYGHPQNPITWPDLTDKFRDCASYSAIPLSKQDIEKTIDMVSHLEEIEDIRQLVTILA
ncbi:MmgE/PrpD family protein [Chloroflexota bacterium]